MSLSEMAIKAQTDQQTKHKRQARGIIELIDAHDDRYVLAKPQDPSKYIEDKALQLSLIYLVVVGYVFAALCDIVRIPSLFGYVAAGIVLGPAVLDTIDVSIHA